MEGSRFGPIRVEEWSESTLTASSDPSTRSGRIVLESYPTRSVVTCVLVWVVGVVLFAYAPVPDDMTLIVMHYLMGYGFFFCVGVSFLGYTERVELSLGPAMHGGGLHGDLVMTRGPVLPLHDALPFLLKPPRSYVQPLASVSSVRVQAVDTDPDMHVGQRGGVRIVFVLEAGYILPFLDEFHLIDAAPFNSLVDALGTALNLTVEAKLEHNSHVPDVPNKKVFRPTLHGWTRLSATEAMSQAWYGGQTE